MSLQKLTKVFFDTEFTGLHQYTTLISIGLVSECGQGFYAEFTDYDELQLNDWLRENVIDNLILYDWDWIPDFYEPTANFVTFKGTSEEIVMALTHWLNRFDKIELWSDCLAYDYVLFCQLWGGAMNIHKNIYYIPNDLCDLMSIKGIDPDISREDFSNGVDLGFNFGEKFTQKHNAMFDALNIMKCCKKIWYITWSI